MDRIDKAHFIVANRVNGVLEKISSSKGGRAWLEGEWRLDELEALCILVREEAGDGADGFSETVIDDAPTEKSVPVSVILEEAADVLVYACKRIAECRAKESSALKHTDFWISRSVARLDTMHWILLNCGYVSEPEAMRSLYQMMHREWRKVRAATGAVSINWD